MTHLFERLAALDSVNRRKRKRKNEEHVFQGSLFDQLEMLLPKEAIVFSVDHANAASTITGANRKRRGVLAGIPDMWILWNPEPDVKWIIVIALETKSRDGRLSNSQKVWREALRAIGVHWGAPRTPEEAIEVIKQAGIPLRGRLA